MVLVCSTCNKEVTKDFIEFKCPKCLKTKIIRCLHCRMTEKPYVCENCSFEGP